MQRRQKAATEKYGETYRVKLIRSYIIATIDAKVFQKISNSPTFYLKKSGEYEMMRPFIGDGLVTSSGYLWQSHRKAIQPAFSMNSLRKYVKIFDHKTKSMVDELKSRCDETLIDVDGIIKRLICDVVLNATMGIDTKNEKTALFQRALVRYDRPLSSIVAQPIPI